MCSEPNSAKVRALYRAGLSFAADRAWKLAEESYREALKLLDPADRQYFAALHYRLGLVAEALGDNEAAEEHYNECAATDYAFDVEPFV